MIRPADLVFYASANVPDTDAGTAGGAFDGARRFDFSPIAAADFIEVLSSAADTRTLTIEGRIADGTFTTEDITLNGTSVVTSVNQYERILKAELASLGAQVVTVRRATGDTLIRQIPGFERGFMAFFRRNDAPGIYYQKGFWYNGNAGGFTMTSAVVKELADPEGHITFALAASINDSGSVANRLTSPGLTFDNSDKAVPGGLLAPSDEIGVWFKVDLPGGDPDHHSTYTTHLTGHTLTDTG